MGVLDAEPSWVVVGSGSAGRRHAAALRRRDPAASITVVRRPESHQPTDAFDALDVRFVPTVADAAAVGPSVAVVAGPAPAHAAAAVALLEAGADVLVEKPIAADRADGAAIGAAAERTGRSVVLGYHLRHDDVARVFRHALERIGIVESFALHVGQYLGGWRPDVDAGRSVTARRDLGGGVLLELSHELDAARWCFGEVAAVGARLRVDGAPTDGLVDTVADLELLTVAGAVGTVHLDMVSEPPRRTWQAIGSDGAVEADLLTGRVRGTGAAFGVDATVPAGWRDRAEDQLIAHLFAVHLGEARPSCSVADGLAVLDLVEAARTSAGASEPGQPVAVRLPRGATGSVR